jgi:hypothetical protein
MARNLNSVLAALPPKRRTKVEKRAGELAVEYLKTVKYTLDSANPLPFTKKQKAELKALSEMPDRKINYCDIPSSLDAQLLEVKKTVSQH